MDLIFSFLRAIFNNMGTIGVVFVHCRRFLLEHAA